MNNNTLTQPGFNFYKGRFFFFLALLTFFSMNFYCNLNLDFIQPTITGSYPKDNDRGIANQAILWVKFSEKMDHQTVENAFSLSSDKGQIKGELRWDGNTIAFTPKQDLITGQLYTMTVLRDAEDISGNNLKEDYEVRFTVNFDSTAPKLISHIPVHGQQGVLPGSTLTFVFSEPVSMASLIDGITISPAITGDFTANITGETITFTPYNPMVYGTLYTVNVSTAVKDVAGNPLFEGTNYSFIIGSDFVKPSISSATSGGIPFQNGLQVNSISKNNPLVITFSEVMDINKTLGAITISPSAPATQTITTLGVAPNQQTQITLTPVSPLEPETLYQLTINTAAVDLVGNLLDQTYIYPFYTNAADSIRPTVTGIREQGIAQGVCLADGTTPCNFGSCSTAIPQNICQRTVMDNTPTGTLPISPSYLAQNDVININYQVDINPLAGPGNDDPAGGDLRLVLNVYFDKPMDFASLAQAVSLNTIISATQTPSISHMTLSSPTMLQIYFDKMISNNGYYKLIIRGGIAKDTNGNALKNDYVFFFYT